MTGWRKSVVIGLALEAAGAACLLAPFAAGDIGPCGPSSVPLSFAFLIGAVMNCVGIAAGTLLHLAGAAYFVAVVAVQTAAWILVAFALRGVSAAIGAIDRSDRG